MTVNKVKGYRNMLGYTQKDMAEKFGITVQAYSRKESGDIKFSDEEKTIVKKLLLPHFPNITIDEIFFGK